MRDLNQGCWQCAKSRLTYRARSQPCSWRGLLASGLFLIACLSLQSLCFADTVVVLNAGPGGQSLAGHFSVLRDADATLNIAQVADPALSNRFSALQGNLGAGYTGAAIWLRFTVVRDAAVSGRRVLEILPPYLDDIRLYEPDAQGEFRERRQGDALPFDARDIAYRGFTFNLDVPPGERTYYVRLRSSSTAILVASLWSADHYGTAKAREYLLFGLANGGLLAIALIAILGWAYVREPLLAHFGLLVLLQLANILTLQGLTFQYLLPENPQWLGALTGGLVGLAAAQVFRFFDLLLEAPRRYPRISRFYRLCIALSLAAAGSAPFGWYAYLAPWLLLCGIVANACAFWPCRDRWRAGGVGNLVELAALALYVAVSTFFLAGLLGLAPVSLSVLNANALATLTYLVLFEFGVFLRIGEANRQRLAAEAEVAQERARRGDQTRFMAMIAHELRTPISIVDAALQSLKALDPDHDAQRSKRYARISRAVQRLNALLQGFLAEERIHSGGWLASAEPVSLAGQTRTAVDELGLGARVRLLIEHETDLPPVTGDRMLLQVVLRNLLENASKYAPADTPIEVALAARTANGLMGVECRISDHGTGIPPHLADRVFEKYYRISESSGTPGFGLGLYLSRRIVERHGGRLSLDTTRTPGASFVFWLPCEWAGRIETRGMK